MHRLKGASVRLTVGGIEVRVESVRFGAVVLEEQPAGDAPALRERISGQAFLHGKPDAFSDWCAALPRIDCGRVPEGPLAWSRLPKRTRNTNQPRSSKRGCWRRRACGRRAKHWSLTTYGRDDGIAYCRVCWDAFDESQYDSLWDGAISPRILKRRMMQERRRSS